MDHVVRISVQSAALFQQLFPQCWACPTSQQSLQQSQDVMVVVRLERKRQIKDKRACLGKENQVFQWKPRESYQADSLEFFCIKLSLIMFKVFWQYLCITTYLAHFSFKEQSEDSTSALIIECTKPCLNGRFSMAQMEWVWMCTCVCVRKLGSSSDVTWVGAHCVR